MAWNPPLTTELEAGDPWDETVCEKIRESLLYLYGVSAGSTSSDVPNGNFEIDSDSDGIPDLWTDDGTSAPIYGGHGDTFPGGTVELDSTTPIGGAQSIKMVHPGGAGNGGGLLESDFIQVSGIAEPFFLGFAHKSTAAAIHNSVIIYWYDKDQVALAGADEYDILYDSVNNPTSTTYFVCYTKPPADARFFTIGLVGGYDNVDVAGTVHFDSVTIHPLIAGRRASRTWSITESSTASATYVSIGSATINTSHRNIPIVISASLGVYQGGVAGANIGYAKLYHVASGTSSTEVTSDQTAYGSESGNPAILTLATDVFSSGGDITIDLYVHGPGGVTITSRLSSQIAYSTANIDSFTV